MNIQKIATVFLLSAWLVACQTPGPGVSTLSQNQTSTSSQLAQPNKLDAIKARVRNKPAYTGPIQVSLQPQLVWPASTTPTKLLNADLSPNSFQIQALPEGPLAFQESFYQDETVRAFEISNTEQRYTLHVEKSAPQLQVEVNINGTDWLKQTDFSGLEAESSSRLLNAHNSIRVRLTGQPGAVATISVVQQAQFCGVAGNLLQVRQIILQSMIVICLTPIKTIAWVV